MSDPPRQLIQEAFYGGPKFLAVGSGLCALGLSLHWAAAGGGPIGLILLLVGFVPLSALAGACAGLILFPLAQWIVGLLKIDSTYWPMAQAPLMAILTVFTVLPFGVWVAGSLTAALSGKQGTHIVLVAAALAGAIAGALFGSAMQRYVTGLQPSCDD